MAAYQVGPPRAPGSRTPARGRRRLPLVSSHCSRTMPLRQGTAGDRTSIDVADVQDTRAALATHRPTESLDRGTKLEHFPVLLFSTFRDEFC
ncbi:hypothetical protein DPMN_036990 [Dreissena polymorpha]|uniref:Uncharacterized protein n=1 Tax=Dreissena polymorpha TaxID=45954 RepID=A0A9D4MBU3_DREPO|nr:hypothetical protein DPMN_036990 [Dreissena polymorpha]